jgi:hypothetical protein
MEYGAVADNDFTTHTIIFMFHRHLLRMNNISYCVRSIHYKRVNNVIRRYNATAGSAVAPKLWTEKRNITPKYCC